MVGCYFVNKSTYTQTSFDFNNSEKKYLPITVINLTICYSEQG